MPRKFCSVADIPGAREAQRCETQSELASEILAPGPDSVGETLDPGREAHRQSLLANRSGSEREILEFIEHAA